MPNRLNPPPSHPNGSQSQIEDPIRLLSRSPHPYHHQYPELSKDASSEVPRANITAPRAHSHIISSNGDRKSMERPQTVQYPSFKRPDSQDFTNSDSGTEADDEHFLKGLPAPRLRPHKGLRGSSDAIDSRTPSPMASPALSVDENSRRLGSRRTGRSRSNRSTKEDAALAIQRARRRQNLELLRRGTEIALLGAIGAIITSDDRVRDLLWKWRQELLSELFAIGGLFLLYPLRIIYRRVRTDGLALRNYFTIPVSFDPAPLVYPPALAAYAAILLSKANPDVLLPNLILGIASLPAALIPSIGNTEGYSTLHWFISCIPLFSYTHYNQPSPALEGLISTKTPLQTNLSVELLSSIYPLHYSLCVTLHYLATTSLLPAELHLLSIALINVLLLASSPQVIILKAVLWGGGIGLLVTCEPVIRWGVALARVPRWRFRKPDSVYEVRDSPYAETVIPRRRSIVGRLSNLIPALGSLNHNSDDEDLIASKRLRKSRAQNKKENNNTLLTPEPSPPLDFGSVESAPNSATTTSSLDLIPSSFSSRQRRHTLPSVSHHPPNPEHTPSGRKKRTASSSIQPFFSLTLREALVRKWLYASYVYICVVLITLVGIRTYVGNYALNNHEPIGWAIGYLFGNISWFRFQVVSNNFECWITLPPHPDPSKSTCILGLIPRLRHATIGEANTRLLLIIYNLLTIITGLLIVFRLSKIYEVDTRRKVFHFMMVLILLPTTFIDPAFCSLALSLILAIFLLLDLFRASQLPPLSKPIAYFLTPYVDGRDLRGPVVVSHIFLLIGCAVPLWLSLGAVERDGEGALEGWEVVGRDVSMVSGVVCVGMGDAAASLIGRRFGRHKWIWPGGKSIEGSIAFAIAVAFGLTLSKIWLFIGGWADGYGADGITDLAWLTSVSRDVGHRECVGTAGKIGLAASAASLAEAVLTGGNDNVVVPLVLWLCVKGLGI